MALTTYQSSPPRCTRLVLIVRAFHTGTLRVFRIEASTTVFLKLEQKVQKNSSEKAREELKQEVRSGERGIIPTAK
jgi:hypothetical protein